MNRPRRDPHAPLIDPTRRQLLGKRDTEDMYRKKLGFGDFTLICARNERRARAAS